MAVTVKIKPTDSSFKVGKLADQNYKLSIVATLQFADGDTLPAPTDKYNFTLTPDQTGTLEAATGSTLQPPLVQDGLDPNKYTATCVVVATAYGVCKISGNKDGDTATWAANATQPVTIVPIRVDPEFKSRPATALQMSDQVGTPTDGPDRTAKVSVIVKDLDGVPVPQCEVSFKIDNVRSSPARISGVFYDAQQALISSIKVDDSGTGTITQQTDNTGEAVLYIGTNKYPGYINISLIAGGSVIPVGYVYIFNPLPGEDLQYPRTYIPGDMSLYTDPTFPVTLYNSDTATDEYVGLFLNGKFEGQTTGASIYESGGTYVTSAQTSHLIADTSGKKTTNSLITHRTQKGDLVRSIQTLFDITKPPAPTPFNPILGPLKDPAGGVINIVSIHDENGNGVSYITIIDLAKDVTTLTAKGYTLEADDILRLQVTLQGDYEDTDNFQIDRHAYTKTITASDLTSNDVEIEIPYNDINGYGTTKNSANKSLYKTFYEVIKKGETDPFASSVTASGPLSTRKI